MVCVVLVACRSDVCSVVCRVVPLWSQVGVHGIRVPYSAYAVRYRLLPVPFSDFVSPPRPPATRSSQTLTTDPRDSYSDARMSRRAVELLRIILLILRSSAPSFRGGPVVVEVNLTA